MQIAIYIIWAIIPLFFFSMALYAKLEQISNKAKKQNPADFMRQGVFVLVCVVICLVIDQQILEGLVTKYSPEFIPLGFYQILLLPLVLYLAAMAFGPSKDLRISNPSTPSSKNKRRRK